MAYVQCDRSLRNLQNARAVGLQQPCTFPKRLPVLLWSVMRRLPQKRMTYSVVANPLPVHSAGFGGCDHTALEHAYGNIQDVSILY